eukprot:GHVP01003691.1.p1 GENE.GHVP01003691.1~~GHVP01003691.1.p1  ORF type:complete len:354 (-),score=89.55 GHVP01003691.1:38-1099(-)
MNEQGISSPSELIQAIIGLQGESMAKRLSGDNIQVDKNLEKISEKYDELSKQLQDFFESTSTKSDSENDKSENYEKPIGDFLKLKISCLSSVISGILQFLMINLCDTEDSYHLSDSPLRFDLVKNKILLEHLLKIEQRQKSRIQRILRNTEPNDPKRSRPKLEALETVSAEVPSDFGQIVEKFETDGRNDEDIERERHWLVGDDQKPQVKQRKSGLYKAPKVFATEMPETAKEKSDKQKKKEERILEKMQQTEEYADLIAEISKKPEEKRSMSLTEERKIRKLKELENAQFNYEEENFRAAQVSKAQKKQLKHLRKTRQETDGYHDLMNIPQVPSLLLKKENKKESPKKRRKF